LFWFHPTDAVFGRFDLAALRGCHALNVSLFVCRRSGGTDVVDFRLPEYQLAPSLDFPGIFLPVLGMPL
jgi:hypothetical protein